MARLSKDQKSQNFDGLGVVAAQILSATVNKKVSVNRVERLTEPGRRNLLLRCSIEPIANLPSSFILKKVEAQIYNPDDGESGDTRRFGNDWVGHQFLNTIADKVDYSPYFYGGDRKLGLIVIEDVQHRHSLVESLLGSDRDRGEWALLQYATCLGNLHTATLGKAEEFYALYSHLVPNMQPAKVEINISQHQSRLESLGISLSDAWLRDLEAIHNTVSRPGEFLAYVHTDACPDNVLDTGKELRLIDFETGIFGHVFLDAAFGRMMFPSCWCSQRLPNYIVQQMEATYRSILIQHCPSAQEDEIFDTALINACGFWLLYTLTRHFETALQEDEDFGISTIRQRIIARLEAFIAVSQELDRLPGLRDTSNQLLNLLSQRWCDVADLPLYPAFQPDSIKN